MNVKFYLRDLSKEKGSLPTGNHQPIWCYITFAGKRLRISTQIKVLPSEWNDAKENIRGTSLTVQKYNQRLKQIRSKAEELDVTYLGKVLTADALKEELLPILFPERNRKASKAKDILEYITSFIESNDKGISTGSMKSYMQLKELLIQFSKSHGKALLSFDVINVSWGDRFRKWLLEEKNHSLSTVDKHIKTLKALMSYAGKSELHQNNKYQHIEREKEEDSKEIYLSKEEIKAIYELDVEPEYESTRDIFVICCQTGQRISDILGLRKHNWKGDYIEFESKKTKEKLQIPLQKAAKRIFEKYNGELPYVYEQKYNKQLKDIAEQIPSLQTEEIIYSTKGGKREQKSVYRYELVKSHTARRSFATNEYLAGTDPLLIRAITGHKTEKDYFRYIRLKQSEKAETLLEIFKNRDDF